MSRALLLGLCLLLGGCATPTPLPLSTPSLRVALPLSVQVQRQQGDGVQDWLLVLQEAGDGLRWSLFDPLGVPLARQQLHAGRWQNDGLLPPNPEARELFAALLFAWCADESRRQYPPAAWQVNASGWQLAPGWQIAAPQATPVQLRNAAGVRYRIMRLAQ